MKLVKILNYSVVALAVFAITACSTTSKVKGSSLGANGLDDQSAQSYALKQNSGYTGQIRRNQDGEIMNSLTAPSDQTYYFAFDSNVLKLSDNDAVIAQANYLSAHPDVKVRLEGNTDNRGSREYNVGLGWRRDQSIAKLLEQHGVLASQIQMVSYGKEHPSVMGNNDYAWKLNRRVNLVYEAK
jgi:peptidoglycan-associated lipoprotein